MPALELIISVFAALVTVAMATVIVSSPNTAKIISAWGESFSSSVRAAMGR